MTDYIEFHAHAAGPDGLGGTSLTGHIAITINAGGIVRTYEMQWDPSQPATYGPGPRMPRTQTRPVGPLGVLSSGGPNDGIIQEANTARTPTSSARAYLSPEAARHAMNVADGWIGPSNFDAIGASCIDFAGELAKAAGSKPDWAAGFKPGSVIGFSLVERFMPGHIDDASGNSPADQLSEKQALKQIKQLVFDHIEGVAQSPSGAYDLDSEIQDALDYLESLRHPYEPEDPVGSVSGGIRDANGVPIMGSIQTPSGAVSLWRGSHYSPGQPNDDGHIKGGYRDGRWPGLR